MSSFVSTLATATILLGSCSILCAQELDAPKPDKQHRPERAEEGRREKDRDRDRPQHAKKDMPEGARQKLEALRREGRHEEAERLQHALASEGHQSPGKKFQPAEGPARLRHVQEAINHLKAAGLHEPAENLEGIAKRMRAEFAEHHRHAAERGKRPGHKEAPHKEAGPHAGGPDLMRVLEEQRGQMQRMARELQELREQVGKLRGDRARE